MISDSQQRPVRPRDIRLEASSACQLRCPLCPTASGATRPVLGRSYLRIEAFRALLDDNPRIASVELSNYGEIFLNPDLLEILEYAHRRGVALTAENGANLNTVRPEVLEGVVKYRLRRLTCSIDGASRDTYEQYRVRGVFDRVIENVRAINAHKRRYRSRYPRLRWQFVVFGHNEHEIPAAQRLARELGMSIQFRHNWDPRFSPLRDARDVIRRTGLEGPSEAAYGRDYGVERQRPICYQLWNNPQINWDGKLMGCCINYWDDFGGNAFEDGLERVLNGERITYARGMLLGRNPEREDIPCTRCHLYQSMKANGTWLTAAETRLPHRLVRFLERTLTRLPRLRRPAVLALQALMRTRRA